MKNVLAVIPARGGSRGIANKNIIEVHGRPLIGYSIEVGLKVKESGLIGELIVSTDSEVIADISRKEGAEVPFLRPDYLSSDTARSVDVMIHAHEFYRKQGHGFDTMLLLQPTTPLRTVEDIENSLKIYEEANATSLISCYLEEYICNNVIYRKDGNIALSMSDNHNKGGRRQEEEKLYVRNGAIYITDTARMIAEHTVFGDMPCMYVMPKERSVNIDTMDDVEMVRWILSR